MAAILCASVGGCGCVCVRAGKSVSCVHVRVCVPYCTNWSHVCVHVRVCVDTSVHVHVCEDTSVHVHVCEDTIVHVRVCAVLHKMVSCVKTQRYGGTGVMCHYTHIIYILVYRTS